jgi:hypothetical protein
MRPAVDLFFDYDQNFYHASCVYAGLDILNRRGAIKLRLRQSRRLASELRDDSLILLLSVQTSRMQQSALIAIDLLDRSDVFARGVLSKCDIYYKRSFYVPDVTSLPADLSCKVKPFGLNYACRSSGSTARLMRTAALPLALRGPSGILRLRHHLLLPKVGDFEQEPTAAVEPTIVFQTRVWEPCDTAPGECDEINEKRVAIIRALKQAFGNRFKGGLVPTPLAIARYPGEVSQYASRRSLYTAMSKRNLIGVYTRGLHHSTAFKLAEYLAASQCIVAEPPRNELPVPLVHEKHFLPFQSVEQCVVACQRLLANNELVRLMRRANRDFYAAEVEPSNHITRLLEPCVRPVRHGPVPSVIPRPSPA